MGKGKSVEVVRAAGIEPARLTAADFKSDASTNFAMPAPAGIVLRAEVVVLLGKHRTPFGDAQARVSTA